MVQGREPVERDGARSHAVRVQGCFKLRDGLVRWRFGFSREPLETAAIGSRSTFQEVPQMTGADGKSMMACRVRPAHFDPEHRMYITRSEERRVGKECVRPCRSRWSDDH